VIGNKTYDISYDPNDNYFNSEAARIARSGELDCLSQILGKFLPKKTEGMINVGANIGLVTLLMEQFVHNSRNILAIEPDRTAYQLLERNCASNHLTPTMSNCGVGEKRGNLHFCSTVGSTSASHIVTKEHIMNTSASSYDVKVERLDSLVAEAGLKQVNFIKIDTEGHEWQILKGSINTLERFNPWVFLEFNSWTLIAFSNISPRVFMEYLMDTYQQVGQVRHGQDVLWIKSQQDVMAFLHDNLVKHGCVDDLLVRYAQEDS
jgi:FkbM family methyltransferase